MFAYSVGSVCDVMMGVERRTCSVKNELIFSSITGYMYRTTLRERGHGQLFRTIVVQYCCATTSGWCASVGNVCICVRVCSCV